MASKAAPTKTAQRKLDVAAPEAQSQAREQATEYESIFGDTRLDLANGQHIMVPPHPDYALLDDDQMDAWDELKWNIDTLYEREEDTYIPEQNLDGGVTLPATTIRGTVKTPYRIKKDDGTSELVKPAHSIQVVKIALGEEGYAHLRKYGGNAKDVWRIWGNQSMLIKERQQRDSFRHGGPVDMAPVSETDS